MHFLLPLFVFIVTARSPQLPVEKVNFQAQKTTSFLVLGKRDTIWVDYRPDHRILYDGGGWRVVMVNPETVALSFLSERGELNSPENGRTWEIKTRGDRKLRVSLAHLGVFDLYGEADLRLRDKNWNGGPSEMQMDFTGDADVMVYLNTHFRTPHYIIKTKILPPRSWPYHFFSVHDCRATDSPYIVRDPLSIKYRKKARSKWVRRSAEKKTMAHRLAAFEKDDVVGDVFRGEMTAPHLLQEITHWYGLDGFALDPLVDTAEKEALYCGSMSRGLPLEKLLSILECEWFHYEVVNNKLFVTTCPDYLSKKDAFRKMIDSLDKDFKKSQQIK